MTDAIFEKKYPIDFRKLDALALGSKIAKFESVDLIGIKRVGINNFLRFFLNHKDIASTYISKDQRFIFIPVDLNDLVERTTFAFWALTMKRLVDAIDSTEFSGIDIKHSHALFLSGIQSKDQFLMIDAIRDTLRLILKAEIVPVFFFIRFDRMGEAATNAFFNNLQGLKEACHQRLVYVFTGYRPLEVLSPEVFSKTSVSLFAQKLYIKPAGKEDSQIIFNTYIDKYKLKLSEKTQGLILKLSNGYVQYLQLLLVILAEQDKLSENEQELFDLFVKDERIILQSEEIFESLSQSEKDLLSLAIDNKDISKDDDSMYLYESGILDKNSHVFSELFLYYLKNQSNKNAGSVHLSKKEHLLYKILELNLGQICERETIVESVWPEYSEFGVTDWAIDRLVARVREKLKKQSSKYEIETIRTRGYMLKEI